MANRFDLIQLLKCKIFLQKILTWMGTQILFGREFCMRVICMRVHESSPCSTEAALCVIINIGLSIRKLFAESRTFNSKKMCGIWEWTHSSIARAFGVAEGAILESSRAGNVHGAGVTSSVNHSSPFSEPSCAIHTYKYQIDRIC